MGHGANFTHRPDQADTHAVHQLVGTMREVGAMPPR